MASAVSDSFVIIDNYFRGALSTRVLKMLGNKMLNYCNICSKDADFCLRLGTNGGSGTLFFICKNHHHLIRKLKGEQMIDAICQVVKKY